MKRYYVYEIWNPIKDRPFYIGWSDSLRKGTKTTRMDDHLTEARRYKETNIAVKWANLHKLRTINKIIDAGIEPIFKVVFDSDNQKEASDKETELIRLYGRADLGLGPLTNLTDGGEGAVNQSDETKKKRSKTMKGRKSPTKGMTFGPHSEERRKNISESLLGRKLPLEQIEKMKGLIPWNKGLTKETDDRVAKYAETKTGNSRPDMVGNEPWNKGLTKETDKRLAKMSEKISGRVAWNKGKSSSNKGKSYEEIYGPEKAAELKERRRQKKLEYWSKKKEVVE